MEFNVDFEEKGTSFNATLEEGTNVIIGGAGTKDYNELKNKPKINSVELSGNKTLGELGIQPKGDYVDELTLNAELEEVVDTFNKGIATKQDVLVSGTNIKTINNQSVLGQGNIDIGTEETDPIYTADKPNIALKSELPTKLSDLNNDIGYITGYTETDPTVPTHVKQITSQDIQNWNSKSEFSGNYNDLTNKPIIPTDNSQLTNGAGYQTANEMQTAINNALGDITGISYSVVEELPSTGEVGVIYLVNNNGENPNIYDEYIYVNNAFEKIGTTETDLSNYVTKTELENKIDVVIPYKASYTDEEKTTYGAKIFSCFDSAYTMLRTLYISASGLLIPYTGRINDSTLSFGISITDITNGVHFADYTMTIDSETQTLESITAEPTIELVNDDDLATKQDTLVSGTNIKTINGNSILGSGNIEIEGGSSTLPIASATTLGGIKVGDGLEITDDGILSAIGGEGGGGSTTTTLFEGNASTNGTEITLSESIENFDFLIMTAEYSGTTSGAAFKRVMPDTVVNVAKIKQRGYSGVGSGALLYQGVPYSDPNANILRQVIYNFTAQNKLYISNLVDSSNSVTLSITKIVGIKLNGGSSGITVLEASTTNVIDFNTLTTPGYYLIKNANTTTTQHSPITDTGTYDLPLEVEKTILASGGTDYEQLAEGGIVYRKYTNGEWYDWGNVTDDMYQMSKTYTDTGLASKSTATNLTNGTATGSLKHINAYDDSGNGLLGEYAFAEGRRCAAVGKYSHAEGYNSIAYSKASHVEGYCTLGNGVTGSHIQGEYNIKDNDKEMLHIVGNGSETQRSNAHTIDKSGNAWFAGDVYVSSTSGTNKDSGSKKLATEEYVDNHSGGSSSGGLTKTVLFEGQDYYGTLTESLTNYQFILVIGDGEIIKDGGVTLAGTPFTLVIDTTEAVEKTYPVGLYVGNSTSYGGILKFTNATRFTISNTYTEGSGYSYTGSVYITKVVGIK